jgi:hypothetical protein
LFSVRLMGKIEAEEIASEIIFIWKNLEAEEIAD